jgi:nitrate reductase gamma subunit
MTAEELLLWARGPGLVIASSIFIFGILVRLIEIFMLGHKKNLAEIRDSGISAGFRTIFSRSLPADRNTLRRSMFTFTAGYVFHTGLFVVIFLLTPHIQLFEKLIGFAWPALATPIVDFFAVLTMLALLAVLWHRLTNSVLRFLSTSQDYLVWFLTFLPVLTGYMSYHHLFFPYTWALALHILSVELMLVLFPFTKFTHAFTLFISRFYNGYMAGQKGVQQ